MRNYIISQKKIITLWVQTCILNYKYAKLNNSISIYFLYNLQVKFNVFEKIDVNGEAGHPLWKYLKKEQGGTLVNFIKWNFTKFIVNKEGKVVERHGPNVDPNQLASHLEKYF